MSFSAFRCCVCKCCEKGEETHGGNRSKEYGNKTGITIKKFKLSILIQKKKKKKILMQTSNRPQKYYCGLNRHGCLYIKKNTPRRQK